MSGFAMIPAMLPPLTDRRTARGPVGEVSHVYSSASRVRIAPQTSCASSGVATSPVPIAQTGS